MLDAEESSLRCPHVQAIEQFPKVGAQLELREFPDGALVVQTLSHSDAVVRSDHTPCGSVPGGGFWPLDKCSHTRVLPNVPS